MLISYKSQNHSTAVLDIYLIPNYLQMPPLSDLAILLLIYRDIK